jgi:hypothetical protein
MSKSIISNERACYICKTTLNLHRHHCIYGTANRKKAEADGLWVYLCQEHHEGPVNGVHGRNKELDKYLHQVAQRAYEAKKGHEAYMKRYRLNWLEEEEWTTN